MKIDAGEEEAVVADCMMPQDPSCTDTPEPLVILVHSAVTDTSAIDIIPSTAVPTHSTPPVPPVTTFIQQGEELQDMISTTSSLVDPDQSVVLATGDDGNMSSFLDSLPLGADVSDDQQMAYIQTDSGQIVCVTFAVAPENGEDVQEGLPDSLHMTGASGIVGLDIEVGLQEHFILNGLTQSSLTVTPSASGDLQVVSDVPCDDAGEVSKTAEQVVAKMRFEDRLRVLEQLLPPTPSRARPSPRSPPPDEAPASASASASASARKTKGPPPLRPRPPSLYVCDLCGACFERPAQFYGHLRRHRDEREYRCGLCPGPEGGRGGGAEFASAAQLRTHQLQYHPGGRPHKCGLCPARFYRASQLSYHIRRDHAGERSHACAICPKAFFKLKKPHTRKHQLEATLQTKQITCLKPNEWMIGACCTPLPISWFALLSGLNCLCCNTHLCS